MNSYPFIFSTGYRFRRHLAFWGFWWIFQAILYGFAPVMMRAPIATRFSITAFEALAYLLPHMFLAYTLMYFLVPRLLLKTKYTLTVLSVLGLFIITAGISACIGLFILEKIRLIYLSPDYNIAPSEVQKSSFFLSLLAGLRGGITIGGLAAAIKLMKITYFKEQKNLQLQKENTASQLQLLKAQVHPHFLFNTLNNIYSYTQHTSPIAARLVTGLSDMLRFVLYDGSQPMVPLGKELNMLQDYIGLEQIRYGNQLEIHLQLPGNTRDIYIAPLLLLPLIENSFKHGTSNMLDQPWISLHITLQGTWMYVKLLNGKPYVPVNKKESQGIGIKNVKKRLELIYPSKHTFHISNEEEVFIIDLSLELTKIISKKDELRVSEKSFVYE